MNGNANEMSQSREIEAYWTWVSDGYTSCYRFRRTRSVSVNAKARFAPPSCQPGRQAGSQSIIRASEHMCWLIESPFKLIFSYVTHRLCLNQKGKCFTEPYGGVVMVVRVVLGGRSRIKMDTIEFAWMIFQFREKTNKSDIQILWEFSFGSVGKVGFFNGNTNFWIENPKNFDLVSYFWW